MEKVKNTKSLILKILAHIIGLGAGDLHDLHTVNLPEGVERRTGALRRIGDGEADVGTRDVVDADKGCQRHKWDCSPGEGLDSAVHGYPPYNLCSLTALSGSWRSGLTTL